MMTEDETTVPHLLKLDEWLNWIFRFIISVSLLVILAHVLKYNLIEPNSIQMLELSIEFNSNEPAAKKGDKEI